MEFVAQDSDTGHATHRFLCDESPSRATNQTRIPHSRASVDLVTFAPKPAAATNRNTLRQIVACCDKSVWVKAGRTFAHRSKGKFREGTRHF
jgi:hypothetical protein